MLHFTRRVKKLECLGMRFLQLLVLQLMLGLVTGKPKGKKPPKMSLETEVGSKMLCVVVGEAREEGTKDIDSVYLNVDEDCDQRIFFKTAGVPQGKLLMVDSVSDGLKTVDGWYLGIHNAEDTDNVPPGPRKSGTMLTSLRAILHRKLHKAAVWKVDDADGHSLVEVTSNWDRSGGITVGWYLSVGPERSKTAFYLAGDMKFASDIRLVPE